METMLDSKEARLTPNQQVGGSSPQSSAELPGWIRKTIHQKDDQAPQQSNGEKRKRYDRTGQRVIRPLLLRGEHSAFDLARLWYAHYSTLSFEDDLINYMRYGFVTVRPHLFGMVRPILYEGERIWFVQIVVGNLLELLASLPCMLPKVAFFRIGQTDKMVVVETERLIELAKQTAKTPSDDGIKERT